MYGKKQEIVCGFRKKDYLCICIIIMFRRLINILLALGVLVILSGCSGNGYTPSLLAADSVMAVNPDSALHILDSLSAETPHWSRSQRMRHALLTMKAQNKAYVPFTSDSIAKNLVSYYNTWGNANERMTAYYLLGCVYRDKRDSPRAIEAYQTAISQADTTAGDCDFLTLSRVHAQMAGEFHHQLLLSKEIEAQHKASRYAFIAKDTINAIFALEKSTSAYILLNKQDSAEIILKDVRKKYMKYGFIQNALQASTSLMYMYVKNYNRLPEAKQLMDEYEKRSNLFDRNHDLSTNRRLYYYYKGQYYDGMNQLDSAEYYYRKVYYPQMPFTAQNSMFEGLLSIYSKRRQPDSIAKYAKLYCEVNDSSIAKKDQELTAQMAATYDYGIYQKEALESESRAYKAQLLVITIVIVLFFCGGFLYIQWKKHLRKQKKEQLLKQREIDDLKEKYTTTVDEYTNNLHTLQLIDIAHQETIALIRQELIKENSFLRERIETLKRQEGLSKQLANSSQFADTEIMKRINYLVNHPFEGLTETELKQLVLTASTYYPSLLHDLNNSPNISQQEIRACILISQALRESDIANLLNTSAQRITNIKATLNKVLFGQSSARSLYKNLIMKYEIYVL